MPKSEKASNSIDDKNDNENMIGLKTLFSENNKVNFQRVVKPKEFIKAKVEKDSESIPKRIKKLKHKHRIKDELPIREDYSKIDVQHLENQETDQEKTVFVGNIPLSESVKSLKSLFKEFGDVISLRLRSVPIAGTAVDDKGNQNLVKKVCANSRNFGDQKGSFNAYVVFKTREEATKALSANNRILNNRHLRVDKSNPTHFDPKLTIFLGSLPYYTDEEELREHFAKLLPNGQDDIENLRLVRDPNTLIGKGIGYLLLKNHDAILKVLSLEQEKFKNRMIRISTCGKRTKRSEKRKHASLENTNLLANIEEDEKTSKKALEIEDIPAKKIKSLDDSQNNVITKESHQNKNSLAATRRIIAKLEQAKQNLIKKKKKKPKSANTGKKTKTKQLGGVLKRAIKASAGKPFS